MIDLSALKGAVRRRRKVWVSGAVLGLLIGAAFHFVVPAKYTAIANLYMVEPANEDPSLAIANDLSLLGTRAVASALGALHLHVDPATFLATYQGTAVSTVILSVKLSAASRAEAVSYDNAVAQAFLAVRSQELGLQTNLVIAGLNAEVNTLTSAEKQLTTSINALSGGKAGPQSANQIESLVNQRASDASQASQLVSLAQQDLLSERATAQGSQVLDPAAAVKVSAKKVTAEDGLAGLVGGLGLAIGAVAIAAAVSDRPRRRAEVAAALDVPVELSLGRYRKARFGHKLRLRRRLKKPSQQMIERRLRAHLEAVPGSALAVLAIGATEPAALGIAALARSLASEGKRVLVADMTEAHPLAWLFRIKGKVGTPQSAKVDQGAITVVVVPDDPGQTLEMEHQSADIVLVLASVSPAKGADHLAVWVGDAVVVVTAGQATVARMATSTLILRQAGITVRSALLLGSDPGDDSPGIVSGAPMSPQRPADARKADEKGLGALASRLHSGNGNAKTTGTLPERPAGALDVNQR